MYGWRARLAVILPLDNTVLEPELQRDAAHGVSVHVLRLTTFDREQMLAQARAHAGVATQFGADLIVYACAETSFFKGQAATYLLEEELHGISGLPVVSATGAKIEALRSLEVGSIALVTPYGESRGRELGAFFDELGLRTAVQSHGDFDAKVGDPREWWGVNIQGPQVTYRMARAAVAEASAEGERPDAIVISATNFRASEIVSDLARDTGLPVVTSNHAMLWAASRRLGLAAPHVFDPAGRSECGAAL